VQQESSDQHREEACPDESLHDVTILGHELLELRVRLAFLEKQFNLPAETVKGRHSSRTTLALRKRREKVDVDVFAGDVEEHQAKLMNLPVRVLALDQKIDVVLWQDQILQSLRFECFPVGEASEALPDGGG